MELVGKRKPNEVKVDDAPPPPYASGVYVVGAVAWCAWVGDEPVPEDARGGSGE